MIVMFIMGALVLFLALAFASKLLINAAAMGKIVYQDTSPDLPPLLSERYRIKAKPDLVRLVPFTRIFVINIQFKSRFRGIYPSVRASAHS